METGSGSKPPRGARPKSERLRRSNRINDGKTGDPIHSLLADHPSWHALLVEPVPLLFERLKRNYTDASRFRFENVAITERAGTSRFYYVDERAKENFPDLPTY